MRRRIISTKNVANILIYNQLAEIIKAEYRYQAQSVQPETESIEDNMTVLKSIESLKDSVIFADAVEWTYENVSENSETEDFILYGDLHDSMIGTIVVIYLRVKDGCTVEKVEGKLRETIFSKKVEEN